MQFDCDVGVTQAFNARDCILARPRSGYHAAKVATARAQACSRAVSRAGA